MKARLYLFIFLVGALAMMVVLQVPAQVGTPEPPSEAQQTTQQKDLVETAAMAGEFTTLLKAIDAAGLRETLKGAGPYTLFAPTDEAFAKLPAGALDALLKTPEKLKQILLYHVVSGTVMSKDAAELKSALSLTGATLTIQAAEGTLVINKATVVQPDLTATNGVIHAIDAVLMPAKP